MGSPSTHKDYWDLYTPVKEIIKVFENSPEGKLEAQLFEKELIRPDLNNPLCLNEGCSGVVSTEINSKTASRVMMERWADPEQRRIMVDRARTRWNDPELRERMAELMSERSKGFWKNEEYRRKVTERARESLTEKWKDPEWRESHLRARIGLRKGEKNPMFGMIYITDGTREGSKVVPKEDPIPEGFIPGRFLNDALFKVVDWFEVVNKAGVNFKKFGWKTKVCKLLGISIHQAENFFTSDRLGFVPYKKPHSQQV